jgi:hypothetical protein
MLFARCPPSLEYSVGIGSPLRTPTGPSSQMRAKGSYADKPDVEFVGARDAPGPNLPFASQFDSEVQLPQIGHS